MADAWTGIVTAVGKALVTKVPGQLEPHRFAHDKALRIVRTIDRLVKVMAASERPKHVDLVRVAALYTCIGLDAPPAGKAPPVDPHQALDDAAELAADHLQNLLPTHDIDLTLRILHDHRLKAPKLPEARLLADAVALEDFGLVGLWNQTRAAHRAGKTLEHLIKLWRTQREYGYWETRLRDGFHFETARKVATERLKQMGPVYDELLREQLAEDVG